jgi:predicted kinase
MVISGLPGAGKSTTARELASRFEPAARVEADQLQRLVVSGCVWPEGSRDMTAEAAAQLRSRLRNACLLACLLARSWMLASLRLRVDR